MEGKDLQWPTSLWTLYAIYGHNTVYMRLLLLYKVQTSGMYAASVNKREPHCKNMKSLDVFFFSTLKSWDYRSENKDFVRSCLCAWVSWYDVASLLIRQHTPSVQPAVRLLTEVKKQIGFKQAVTCNLSLFWEHSLLSHHHMDKPIMCVCLLLLKAYIYIYDSKFLWISVDIYSCFTSKSAHLRQI